MEVRVIIKYLVWAILGWLLLSNVWPVYSGAYKVRKAMVETARTSGGDGLSRAEVIDKAWGLVKASGVTAVEKSDLDAVRNGQDWVLSASYEVKRPVFRNIYLIYTFDIANDRKWPWIRNDGE